MSVLELPIRLDLFKLNAYCATQPIRRLAVFGSALHGDFTVDSDLDLLVEYDDSASVSYLDMARHELDLRASIGRQVDLRTAAELSRYFRESVVAEAVVVYERD